MGCRYCSDCGRFSDPGTKDVWKINHGCFHDGLQADIYRAASCLRFDLNVFAGSIHDLLFGPDVPETGGCEYRGKCAAGELPRREAATRGCGMQGEEGGTHRSEHCIHYRASRLADMIGAGFAEQT